MSHTNTTPNYSLPQFITTDKPAWLTDINGAFLALDTAVDNAQDAADAAQNDATQALSDAGSASTAAATADAKGSGAIASIADTFDPTTIYAVGDYVMYNSLLYVCSVAVVTPGPWTGATNWSRVTVESIIAGLTGLDIKLDTDPSAPTLATAIGNKQDKAIIYTSTTDTVTITSSTSYDVALVFVNRRWIPYNASLEIISGSSASEAQIVEKYRGTNVTVTKVDGQTFTINETGMNGARIIILPIYGTWSITG